MNRSECVMLARYVAALFPHQAIDEFTGEAWHDVIGHLRLDDAREAVRRLCGKTRFLGPTDIREEVGRMRDARIEAAGPLCPPRGLTDAEERRWLHATRQAVADGEPPPVLAIEGRERPVPELVAALDYGMPADVRAELGRDDLHSAAVGVDCPWCGAGFGETCVNAAGRPLGTVHDARRAAARGEQPEQRPVARGPRAPIDLRLPDDPSELIIPADTQQEIA